MNHNQSPEPKKLGSGFKDPFGSPGSVSFESKPLPKVRGQPAKRPSLANSGHPIRVAPIRRSSVQPDAWGLHSVPGMLNDFQRHSSIQVNMPLENETIKVDYMFTWFSLSSLAIMFLACCIELTYHDSAFNLLVLCGAIWSVSFQIGDSQMSKFSLGLHVGGLYFLGIRFAPLVAGISCIKLQKSWLRTWKVGWISLVGLGLCYFNVIGGLLVSLGCLCKTNFKELQHLKIVGTSLGIGSIIFSFLHSVPNLHFTAVLVLAMCACAVYHVTEQKQTSRYVVVATFGISALLYTLSFQQFNWDLMLQFVSILPSVFLKQLSPAVAKHRPASLTLLDSILMHKDTRNIFFFFLLNFGFMFIQLLYSLLSHSLVLMSDSIHMFFDCLALLVGLVASILAKLPPSTRFPFGVGLVETVSGFANGCLLLAISIGIMFESFERVMHPVELKRINELMVVSVLGLLVNLVGIFVFNHGHAHGHAHGHSHGHDHQHDHDHNHDHKLDDDHVHEKHVHDYEDDQVFCPANLNKPQDSLLQVPSFHDNTLSHNHTDDHHHNQEHEHEHEHDHKHDHSHELDHTNDHKHDHKREKQTHDAHDHSHDNIQGIFLHIVADTLGSIGAILATLLTLWTGWPGFDAVMSMIISILIFMSALPLVKSSAKALLLGLNDHDEYRMRDVLNDIYNTPDVVSYKQPKFWNDGKDIRGVIHVQYKQFSLPDEVRERVRHVFRKAGINDVFIQMEEENNNCWCREN